VSNAVKFSLPGGEVSVVARRAGDRVEIDVADSGLGIAQEELPHVFDRFFRSRSSIKMAVPGTGLGLAIARAIAQEHGGTLTVRSEPDRGTTFTLALPSTAGSAPDPAEGRPWLVSSSSTTTPTS
jgi:two-component system phosphate regulon sensor histidine kinase PhoR